MEEQIHIYNASAGSGKTFTLVKEYLKKVLQSPSDYAYKSLLAITFTNKAVAEMKERIVSSLIAFASSNPNQEIPEMLRSISEEIEQPVPLLQGKSKNVLTHILHHYASFSVDTIDRFNHQLIRTFARDLNLASNFEVSLDTHSLLSEAVDKLIDKAGTNKAITNVLLDFVLEKTDDDRSWDISKDLVAASKLLYQENEAAHIKKLKGKTLQDFSDFKETLQKERAQLHASNVSEAKKILTLITESGLEKMDFSRGSYYNHFAKLAAGDFTMKFDAQWQTRIEEAPLYSGTTLKKNRHAAETIDALAATFIAAFQQTKKAVFRLQFLENVSRNITPLSVLNLVQNELSVIKEENNILPISEFNAIINKEIKQQPAPFIYERLGERYRHFFIDEFQDTSLLQWENLIPLVENAVTQQFEQETSGSVLLVGDAKQSIYRWRGGLPEQFINLTNNTNPFPVKKKVDNLPSNYRSFKAIVDFNNELFTHSAAFFGDEMHAHLYTKGNDQEVKKTETGYVQIEFVDVKYQHEKHEVYPSKIKDIIDDCLANDFQLRDICILTRKKKDGIAISEFLLEQQIPVVSQETLLLQSSPIVKAFIDGITLSLYPSRNEVKVGLLDFLYAQFSIPQPKHTFFANCVVAENTTFKAQLEAFGIDFDCSKLEHLSLYESCEYMIRKFQLSSKIDAYVYGFLDLISEFQQQPKTGVLTFLEYWERKKDTASVAASESLDAVQIMTIHKAKGLEFPVVVFPYSDLDIYDERDGKIWLPILEEKTPFDEVLLSSKKELEHYSPEGAMLYNKRRETLELDSFNLLYVTLTRAVEQLYIISKKPTAVKDGNPTRFSQLFMSYLRSKKLWNEDQIRYAFGSKEKKKAQGNSSETVQVKPTFIASTPANHNLLVAARDALLWDTSMQEAINIGTFLHDTMALVLSRNDTDLALERMFKKVPISEEIRDTLKQTIDQIVMHPQLKHLFDGTDVIRNERDIVTYNGLLIRPDRLNIRHDKTVTIVDYKTGVTNEKHAHQINTYGDAMEEMGFVVTEKLLVYVSDSTIMINKV